MLLYWLLSSSSAVQIRRSKVPKHSGETVLMIFFFFLSLSPRRAFFDHSMHSALPLGIYLATKFWMYATWFYWFWNDILFWRYWEVQVMLSESCLFNLTWQTCASVDSDVEPRSFRIWPGFIISIHRSARLSTLAPEEAKTWQQRFTEAKQFSYIDSLFWFPPRPQLGSVSALLNHIIYGFGIKLTVISTGTFHEPESKSLCIKYQIPLSVRLYFAPFCSSFQLLTATDGRAPLSTKKKKRHIVVTFHPLYNPLVFV